MFCRKPKCSRRVSECLFLYADAPHYPRHLCVIEMTSLLVITHFLSAIEKNGHMRGTDPVVLVPGAGSQDFPSYMVMNIPNISLQKRREVYGILKALKPNCSNTDNWTVKVNHGQKKGVLGDPPGAAHAQLRKDAPCSRVKKDNKEAEVIYIHGTPEEMHS